jgi:hypothetical protein
VTKRDDEDDLDLDLELEFEEFVGEPRPMTGPPDADADGDQDGDEDVLEIAGDLLADTGDELLASLSDADDELELGAALEEAEDTPIELTGWEPEPADEDSTPRITLGAAAAAGGAGLVAEPGSASTTTRGAAEAAAGDGGELEGQWVWQFAAPPPPAPFSAVFFSGRALPELYWFFASALLVLLGCAMPWGPSLAWVVERGESTLGYTSPPAGYELPGGALCLAVAVWLLAAAAYGIYTGRQKILPVFMMLLPAWLSWSRALSAWGEVGAVSELGFKERIARLFEVAGTGVLLTMVGSTIVALQLLVVITKVMKKQPADAGRARKGGDKPAAKERGKGSSRDKDADKGKRKSDAKALAKAEKAAAKAAAKAGKQAGSQDGGTDTVSEAGKAGSDVGKDAAADDKPGRGARGTRGRRR